LYKEFKDFALKGNAVDLAIGIILGVAFGGIISSLVADLLMPPIGMLLGNVDFSNLFFLLKTGNPSGPYYSISEAIGAGAITINYGLFINTLINFAIVSFAMFLLVRSLNRMKRSEQEIEGPSTKDCPYCYSKISIKAIRCSECTSKL